MFSTMVRRLLDVRGVPTQVVMTVVLASYGGIVLAAVAGWPLWGVVLAALLPWGLVLVKELQFTWRHHGWIALFYLLVVTQGGHLLEHFIQFMQVNAFGLSGEAAAGVFGALDTEWVHFVWNTWVLAATIPLVLRYRTNRWLWLALAAAVWHEVEHAYLIVEYVRTGLEGNPGLLSEGGVVAGGLPASRVNLHFYYNLVETIPLFAAFGVTLKQARNEWLARAFEGADEETLVDASNQAQVLPVAAGGVLIRQGDPADAFYVVSSGSFEVVQQVEDGEVRLAEVGPGATLGEIGLLDDRPRSATVRALTDAEVVRLDRATFATVVQRSEEAAERLRAVARQRSASSAARG